MYEAQSNTSLRQTAKQFFDDLAQTLEGGQLPLLRKTLDDYLWEVLNHAGHPATREQLRGFINGLVVAERLDQQHGKAFMDRLRAGQSAGWL